MDANSKEEIEKDGDHLNLIRSILADVGLGLLHLAPEVAVHCDEESARPLLVFCNDVLRPIIESIDGQLDVLFQRYASACGEVEDLEKLLQMEES